MYYLNENKNIDGYTYKPWFTEDKSEYTENKSQMTENYRE